MARKYFTHCLQCGAPDEEKVISRKGYCYDCGAQRMIEAARQISAKQGPFYDRYMQGLRGYTGHIGRPETPFTEQ